MEGLIKQKVHIHVAVTATQKGASKKQLALFTIWFQRLLDETYANGEQLHFHHGDCIGGDKQCHDIVRSLHHKTTYAYVRAYVHVHPPKDGRLRAYCRGDFMHTPKPYLVRNHDMVDVSSKLAVVPRTAEEELRSGTWATYRYAKKKGISIAMFLP